MVDEKEVKIYEGDNFYFSVCEKCGSIEWLDDAETEAIVNSLERDGNIIYMKQFEQLISEQLSKNNISPIDVNNFLSTMEKQRCLICADCEYQNPPILFSKVSLHMRKKIWKMKSAQRIYWVKGYLISDVLVREYNEVKNE